MLLTSCFLRLSLLKLFIYNVKFSSQAVAFWSKLQRDVRLPFSRCRGQISIMFSRVPLRRHTVGLRLLPYLWSLAKQGPLPPFKVNHVGCLLSVWGDMDQTGTHYSFKVISCLALYYRCDSNHVAAQIQSHMCLELTSSCCSLLLI